MCGLCYFPQNFKKKTKNKGIKNEIFHKICDIVFLSTNLLASSIDIDNATIRLMPASAKMTAGYFIFANKDNKEIVLVGAKSNFFKHIEIHQSLKDGDVMKMIKKELSFNSPK